MSNIELSQHEANSIECAQGIDATTHEHLTPSVKAEAARLMVVASDINHPGMMKAIYGICDIERTLTHEARDQLYEYLSALDPDNIDDCREVYRDDHDFL